METLISTTWNNWLLVSFLAPILWALINIIDVYFVEEIYRDEWDGVIISDIFQMLPWIILIFLIKTKIPFLAQTDTDGVFIDRAVMMAIVGGFLFSTAFYFYFKSLSIHNDVALVQILWNLCIVVVPVLAFFFFKEVLPLSKYAGMAVTLFGATLLSFNQTIRRKVSSNFFFAMLGAIMFLSISMILEDQAYSLFDLKGLGEDTFWVGFFYFSVGVFLSGLLFIGLTRRNPLPMIKKYFGVFALAEGLNFLGNFASQRALSISPSVSFVATIETFVPAFVLIYSLLILFGLTMVLKGRSSLAKNIYRDQVQGGWVKLLAALIMSLGVYIIS